MRPAGRGPLDQLYFRYPTFAARANELGDAAAFQRAIGVALEDLPTPADSDRAGR